MASASFDLWDAVGHLVDRAPSLNDLRSHHLHLLAARHWRACGREVSADLAIQELMMTGQITAARRALRAVAEALDQEVIVVKGLALADSYPRPELRPFADLDVLVADSARAQRELLGAGFVLSDGRPEGRWDGHHHEPPLVLAGLPSVQVEIHSRSPWIDFGAAPGFQEVRATARPSGRGDVLYPDPALHAVIVACHSWHSLPLRRVSDFVDIAAVSQDQQPGAMREFAHRWGVEKLWSTSWRVMNALLGAGPAPGPLRTWARDLSEVRERTLLEQHLRRWCAPFAARGPRPAFLDAARVVREDMRPVGEESWSQKLERLGIGLRDLRRPISVHDHDLGEAAQRSGPLRSSGIPRSRVR